jgi:hypothetical protein
VVRHDCQCEFTIQEIACMQHATCNKLQPVVRCTVSRCFVGRAFWQDFDREFTIKEMVEALLRLSCAAFDKTLVSVALQKFLVAHFIKGIIGTVRSLIRSVISIFRAPPRLVALVEVATGLLPERSRCNTIPATHAHMCSHHFPYSAFVSEIRAGRLQMAFPCSRCHWLGHVLGHAHTGDVTAMLQRSASSLIRSGNTSCNRPKCSRSRKSTRRSSRHGSRPRQRPWSPRHTLRPSKRHSCVHPPPADSHAWSVITRRSGSHARTVASRLVEPFSLHPMASLLLRP